MTTSSEFVTIDVETANADMASICQIGVARYLDGRLVDEWVSLVNPEDYFEFINIEVHGIEPEHVENQPTFPEIADRLRSMLDGQIAVCHTHFDKRAITAAFEKYTLPQVETRWLDSARVARRTWADVASSGYGLAALSERIGFKFKHHDALEDAKAAGAVFLAALQESQQPIEYWLHRVEQPINPTSGKPIERDGNPDGPFAGEVLVFTGELDIPRAQAADIAAAAGFQVDQGVTKKTTILVVGTQDAWKLKGGEKSAKHLKAEALAQKGKYIRIITERDFAAMTRSG
jgi:DNA polymerase-3 subunit epsilon